MAKIRTGRVGEQIKKELSSAHPVRTEKIHVSVLLP